MEIKSKMAVVVEQKKKIKWKRRPRERNGKAMTGTDKERDDVSLFISDLIECVANREEQHQGGGWQREKKWLKGTHACPVSLYSTEQELGLIAVHRS
ncbi:hypothetical protein CDAR_575811 [Caerostris darwini]|uniref:Uncharacterized protein n=1 Tax=Caerostris darwini TaxID=1538125 RepID=A0AAV4X9V9_9ARAC|nr:hypothetical protein CDAR_575811 [Caerostris darwini]